MPYRSERFDAGELTGLQQAWAVADLFDANHVPIVNEVMAGTSYRRQLDPETREHYGDVNYLLQVTLEPEVNADGARLAARPFLDKAVKLLEQVEMPGEVSVDKGGIDGWDITTTKKYPFGTGDTNTEIVRIYSPWLQAKWQQAGKSCMFFMGIQPPRPRTVYEDLMFSWDEWSMRHGHVMFVPTPFELETR